MNDEQFVFDDNAWEEELTALTHNGVVDAMQLLQLLELEDEQTVQDALVLLEQQGIALDVSSLPPVALTGSVAMRLRQEEQLAGTQSLTDGLEPNDPLVLYLQELAATPAAGDPQLLALRYLDGEPVAEQLVTLCLSRVVEHALQHTGHGVLLMDLIQEGSLGLWEGILSYAGGDFLTHADWWIRQYMAKSVTMCFHSNGTGQQLRRDMQDYLDADQRLLTELGRNPTTEELAEALHKSPEACAMLEKLVLTARAMENARLGQQEPEPNEDEEQAVENTAYFQLRQRIQELLSGLTAEDAKLLTLRFGLENGKALSPEETAGVLQITPQQVVEREGQILAMLRKG